MHVHPFICPKEHTMRHWKPLAVSVTVLALVFGVPASASAAAPAAVVTGGVVSAAPPPDFTPSPNKWRKWMISQLGSVLGNAMPSKWKAENLANQLRYSHSWEEWGHALGIDGVRKNDAGQVVGIKYTNRGTGTYDDVVIEGLEDRLKEKHKMITKNGVRTAVPATKGVPFKKLIGGAGGALTAVLAYDMTTMLTAAGMNTVGGWFGWDPNGAVCSAFQDGSVGSWIATAASGQNCDVWAQNKEYLANQDAATTYSGEKCMAGTCIVVTGRISGHPAVSDPRVIVAYCGHLTFGGTYTTQWDLSTGSPRSSSGTWPNGLCPGGIGEMGLGYYFDPFVMRDLKFMNGTTEVGRFTHADIKETHDDPQRTDVCKVTATDGTVIYGEPSAPYREGEGRLGGAACPEIPAGKVPAEVEILQRTPGMADQSVYKQPVGEAAQSMFDQYQECMYGACALDLLKLDEPGAPSCFDLDDGCPGWWEAPNRAEVYQCRYGVHNVPIQECAVYSGLFEPGRTAVDAPYSDPTTGEWSGGKNTLPEGQKAMTTTIQDPEAIRGCDLTDIGFDPIGWVVRPGQCLMQWSFVPRPTVVEASMAGAGEAWEGKPPAVIAQFADTVALAPSASGCSKSVTLFGSTFNIIDACSGPMAGVATISRIVTAFGMVVLVIVVLRRQIAGMVGYNQGQG